MTQFDPRKKSLGGDVPDDLPNLLEPWLFFLGAKYNEVHGATTYAEQQSSAVDAGQRPIGAADVVGTPQGSRGIIRASVPCAANWASVGAAYLSVTEQKESLFPE